MREPLILKNPRPADIVEALVSNEEVLIEGKQLKIVTPKDVLRSVAKPGETAYVQITGLDEDDTELAEKTHQEARLVLKRMSRVSELQPLKIVFEKHSHGGRTKYSVNAQLPTQLGTFVSTKSYGWNGVTAMQKSLKNLEVEIMRKFEKIRTQRRKGRTRGKR
jgi:hypothetical protein